MSEKSSSRFATRFLQLESSWLKSAIPAAHDESGLEHPGMVVTVAAARILVAVAGLAVATALLTAANQAERGPKKIAQDAQVQAERDRKLAVLAQTQAEEIALAQRKWQDNNAGVGRD